MRSPRITSTLHHVFVLGLAETTIESRLADTEDSCRFRPVSANRRQDPPDMLPLDIRQGTFRQVNTDLLGLGFAHMPTRRPRPWVHGARSREGMPPKSGSHSSAGANQPYAGAMPKSCRKAAASSVSRLINSWATSSNLSRCSVRIVFAST